MTLIELFDPHDLAFPLKGQLEESFVIEVIDGVPKDLSGRKSNLLIIVGKDYAELDQYKVLKGSYLAIVVFIKDMEATQIRSLQHMDESFDAYFGIPWQKTALKFYLEDLAEYKAMELKDELELSENFKGNQSINDHLQGLFDLAPGKFLPFGESTSTNTKNPVIASDNNEDNIAENIDTSDEEVKLSEEEVSIADEEEGIDLSAGEVSIADEDELDLGDEEVSIGDEEINIADEGISLGADDLDLSSEDSIDIAEEDNSAEEVSEDEPGIELGELEFGTDLDLDSDQVAETSEVNDTGTETDMSLDVSSEDSIDIGEEDAAGEDELFEPGNDDLDLSFSVDDTLSDIKVNEEKEEEEKEETEVNGSLSLSQDAVKKLKEIDQILDKDKSPANEDGGDELDFSAEEIETKEEQLPAENLADDEEFSDVTMTEVIPARKLEELALAQAQLQNQNQAQEQRLPIANFDGDLERAGAIIAELRGERDYLEKRVNELEKEKMLKGNSTLDIRAELNENRIELQIIKKRHQSDLDQLRLQIAESLEKQAIAEEKKKYFEQELEKMTGQVNFDLKKIKSRERELEDRLDLLRQDAEVQIRNRDSSIIDLKRKIDMLEFNLDNAVQKDKKNIESRFELENKVDQVMQTLRGAIGVLEEDIQESQANPLIGEINE